MRVRSLQTYSPKCVIVDNIAAIESEDCGGVKVQIWVSTSAACKYTFY